MGHNVRHSEVASFDRAAGAVEAGPTRLHIFFRLLWLCFYSVAIVLGGNVMLGLPQVREGLWAFDDGEVGGDHMRQAIFILAFLFWAVSTWYVARLTLGCRFRSDSVGSSTPFVHTVAKWLPRALSVAATLPLSVYLLNTGKHNTLAFLLIALSLVFLTFVWGRRRWFDSSEGDGYYRYFDSLKRSSKITLGILFLIPHVVLVAICIDPISTGRTIGAPALILLAMGGWTLFGGILLSYWPRTRGWITWNWVPIALFFAFYAINDNHPVDWAAGPREKAHSTAMYSDSRPLLKEHYESWMKHHRAMEPVYLVASAGGATRASYWAGAVLGRLEDEARAAGHRFGSNIYMMSGISGGSVGIAAFAAALQAWPSSASGSPRPNAGCIRLAMDRFLGADVLSPIGGLMLYPDLIQRFLPEFNFSQRIDRSRGLEEAWVRDWGAMIGDMESICGQSADNSRDLWELPLVAALPPTAGTPAVILNTVRLDDGRRVVQSNVRVGFRDAVDLLGDGFEERARKITLAGAAHNSARFPLVSPPGTVYDDKGKLWGYLGDGGYHEVTGTAALADMVEELIELGCLRRDPARLDSPTSVRLLARRHCGRAEKSGKADSLAARARGNESSTDAASTDEFRVVVVLLDNTPTGFPERWHRGPDGTPRPPPPQVAGPVEITAPITGLFSHSAQEARTSVERLIALAGTDPLSLIELRFPRYRGLREPSMNWQLDRESRLAMMCAADRDDAKVERLLFFKRGEELQRCMNKDGGPLPRTEGRPANLSDEALLRNLDRIRALIITPPVKQDASDRDSATKNSGVSQ